MGPKLILKWSRRSIARLDQILNYIAQDNPAAGVKLAAEIRSKAELLRWHPYLGREVFAGTRELVVHRNYLLTYRIKRGRIEIIQVWHVAQDR